MRHASPKTTTSGHASLVEPKTSDASGSELNRTHHAHSESIGEEWPGNSVWSAERSGTTSSFLYVSE